MRENSTAKPIGFSILILCRRTGPAPIGREIERKFLLKQLPERLKQARRCVIAQDYLADSSSAPGPKNPHAGRTRESAIANATTIRFTR